MNAGTVMVIRWDFLLIQPCWFLFSITIVFNYARIVWAPLALSILLEYLQKLRYLHYSVLVLRLVDQSALAQGLKCSSETSFN